MRKLPTVMAATLLALQIPMVDEQAVFVTAEWPGAEPPPAAASTATTTPSTTTSTTSTP